MKSPGMDGQHIKRTCTVYDVEEKDPAKKVIAIFGSVTECAKFLGLTTSRICDIIKRKNRNKTNKLGKTICIR